MSDTQEDIKNLREEFEGIDRAIIDGAKNMRAMQATLSRTNAIMGSKNWEVFSRFISGTGLWRVQNRIKATVILLNEMASSTERRRLEEVKQLKVYAEIADTSKEIQDIQANIEKAEKATGAKREAAVEAIRKQSKIFGGLLFQHQDQNKALREMSKLMDKQVKDIEKLEKAATKGARRRKEGIIANMLTVKASVAISNKMKEASKFAKDFVGQQYTKVTDAAAAISESKFGVGEKELDKRFDEAGLSRDMKIVTDKSGKERITGGGRKGFSSKEDIAQLRALQALEKDSNKRSKRTLRFIGRAGKFVFKPLTDIAKFAGRIAKGIMSIVRTMFMAAGYLLLIMLGLTILRNVFEENKEAFVKGFKVMKETFGVGLSIISTGIDSFVEALNNIWSAFQDGNIVEVVAGVGQLLVASLQILAGVLVATIGSVIMGAVEFIRNVFNTRLEEIREDFATTRGAIVAAGLHVVKVVAKIALGIALIAALFIGLPAILFAAAMAAIIFLADKLIPHADAIGKVLGGIYDVFVSVKDFLYDNINLPTLAEIKTALKEAVSPEAVEKVGDGIRKLGNKIGGVFGFAQGGIVPKTGMHMVGERGPELVRLPQGSRVYNNSDTRSMMGGGSVTNNITVQVTGRVGASDTEIRDIANKVAREINTRMNRTSTSVVKF
mgnify:CR=1 FL=1|tara:strand:- start:71 stop:2071 length:2001 start_codon:yes stop_codon:yes gene_type:complete